MNIVLFDGNEHQSLKPLTLTKPVAKLRVGIMDFASRWSEILDADVSFLTQDYLSEHFPIHLQETNHYINPSYFPNQELIQHIKQLKPGNAIVNKNNQLLAAFTSHDDFLNHQFKEEIKINNPIHIQHTWDLFMHNHTAINFDFDWITTGRKSEEISPTNGLIGNKIFIESGAKLEYATLNSKQGPIYIGKDTEVMEGSHIRGALALCQGAKINMGAKIYGATTIGPYSKVGGEVNNAILTAYSNKGHDGFLGNSVIGEWCNLGADTNNSNLKNNYSNVKMWNYQQEKFLDTGLQFCGLIMADHSKAAINTQFNTGTTIGVACNIFKSGFPPNLINSFSWGGHQHDPKYLLEKCFETEEKMMQRRNINLADSYKKILEHLYNQ